jgi:dihydrofolate synthase/folylpolyglutamate synthase
MRELARRSGDPQNDFPSLHIAGSKGKGSTSAMTTAILQAAGYRTGLYTSPHLHTFRERLRIDGQLIPRQRLVDLWEQARPVVKSLPRTTTFEIITLLAFMYFAQEQVDWAVLEVGLGGRLDATNIISPAACAITALSLEHTDLLGDTIAAIAAEKAGIIKPGAPVVTGPQPPEAMAVIERTARETGVPLIRVGEDWRWQIREQSPRGLRLDIYGPDSTITDIELPLTGAHQAVNATVAVALLHSLRARGVDIPPGTIRQGLARTYWPGRLEMLSEQPAILLDSAHNRDSATRLRNALDIFPHRRLILLFGVSGDKDITGMLEILGAEADAIILTRSFHPRAADPARLAPIVRTLFPDKPVILTDVSASGLQRALELAGPEDLILVTGSIFVVAAVREAWAALYPRSLPPDDWAHFAEPIDGQFTPMLTSPPKKHSH